MRREHKLKKIQFFTFKSVHFHLLESVHLIMRMWKIRVWLRGKKGNWKNCWEVELSVYKSVWTLADLTVFKSKIQYVFWLINVDQFSFLSLFFFNQCFLYSQSFLFTQVWTMWSNGLRLLTCKWYLEDMFRPLYKCKSKKTACSDFISMHINPN